VSHKHERHKSKVNLTKITINFLSILQIQKPNVYDSHVETNANSNFTFLFKPKGRPKLHAVEIRLWERENTIPTSEQISKYDIFSKISSHFTFKVELTLEARAKKPGQ